MAITFLGYIDGPEEMISGKKRCLFGLDSAADVANLPTSTGFSMPSGGVTAKPAPWSYAKIKGGGVKVLDSTGSWGDLNG
jgi:hypothetical protein